MSKGLYRSVWELPQGSRDFLRWSLFSGGPEYEGLDEDQQKQVDNCSCSEEIPDDLLNYAFSGYSFCPEDFNGDAGDDWEKV